MYVLRLCTRCCSFVDTRSENGFTALHLAAMSGNLLCMQILLRSGASMMVCPSSPIPFPVGEVTLLPEKGHEGLGPLMNRE